MAAKLKVTYNDGTVIEVVASPKAQVMAERFLRQQGGFADATIVEASIRLAFEASKPGIGNVGYEEWLDNVADVDELPPEPEPDPTPEAPSPTPSSD
jgi:hypothetical protein